MRAICSLFLATLTLTPSPLLAASGGGSAAKDRPRLMFYGVRTDGNLPAWKVRLLLKGHERTRLGCHIARPDGKTTMRGSVRVEGTIGKGGKLLGLKVKASGDHRSLEACATKAIRRWSFSSDKRDVGTRLRFTFYVSFRRSSGVLGALRAARADYGVSGGMAGGVAGGSGGLGVAGIGRGSGTLGRRSSYTRYRSSASIDQITSSGALQQGVVSWAVQQLRLESNVRYCHQRVARDDPKVGGRYKITLRVGKNGGLEKLELLKDTVSNVQLQSCVMRYLLSYSSYRKTTPFPSASGTTDVTLSLTFPTARKTN